MNRIIILAEELEAQMRMYLALCNKYKVEIAEDESMLLRLIRRKNPRLIVLDAGYSGFNNNGKSVHKIIEKIKSKYRNVKVLTILDHNGQGRGQQAAATASDGVLHRPVDEERIIQSVQRHLSVSPQAMLQ